MAGYLAHHPFFLIFLSGIALGITLSQFLRRPARQARPTVFRRRRRIVVPLSAIGVVAFAGLAFQAGLRVWGAPVGWIGVPGSSGQGVSVLLSAAILFGGATVVTGLAIIVPKWWRLAVIGPAAVLLLGPVPLWAPFPFGYLQPLAVTGLGVAPDDAPDDALSIGSGNAPTEQFLNSVATALIRVRREPGGQTLAVTVSPTSDLLPPAPAEGVPSAPRSREMTLPAEGAINFRLAVIRIPGALWWLPPTELPLSLTVSVGEREVVLARYRSGSPAMRILSLGSSMGILGSQTLSLSVPPDGDGYLQPGVYIVLSSRSSLSFYAEQTDSQ